MALKSCSPTSSCKRRRTTGARLAINFMGEASSDLAGTMVRPVCPKRQYGWCQRPRWQASRPPRALLCIREFRQNSANLIGGCGPQPLRIHVDDQRGEENQAANQNLQEAVDVDMVEAIVQDAEDEQSDNGVTNPS